MKEVFRVITPFGDGRFTAVNGKVAGDADGRASITKYMRGWTLNQVRAYVVRRHWALERVETKEEG